MLKSFIRLSQCLSWDNDLKWKLYVSTIISQINPNKTDFKKTAISFNAIKSCSTPNPSFCMRIQIIRKNQPHLTRKKADLPHAVHELIYDK